MSSTQPLKVLCITSHVGSLTNVRPEAEWFIGLARLGMDVTVMTEGNSCYADRMRDAGVRVVDFALRRRFDPPGIRRIRRRIAAGRHDILHLFNNRAITNGIFASVGLPVNVVTYRGQTGNIKRYDPSCYLTHLSPRVDCITCVSDAVRQDLIANGVAPDKAVTVYKGHDLHWYDDTSPEDRAALGVPRAAFALACVANNRPRKGVPVLIEAARALDPTSPIHILLVGTGMTSPEITALIAAGPRPDRFHVFDYRPDVLQLVAACDATVLPATKREGLPKTVIESMALGIAPIVTRTGGSPELVEDGISGLVVPPNDPGALATAMQGLADDPGLARRMGAAARERLRTHFSLDRGVRALATAYESLRARARG